MLWKSFNDQLALLALILIVALWVGNAFMKKWCGEGVPAEAIGATIAVFTLIMQFYFRRKEPNEPTNGNGGTK